MRNGLLALILFAFGCQAAPQRDPRAPKTERRTSISPAEADEIAAAHFQLTTEGLDVAQQKALVTARARFRRGLQALSAHRFDAALDELTQIQRMLAQQLAAQPLDRERAKVRELMETTTVWRAEARYRQEMLLREEARLRAQGG